MFRIGTGFDVHRLVEGRRLILGGVEISSDIGLLGHSDADVLTHAVADAALGALALGDIGQWFPDTDSSFKDACSIDLLKTILNSTQLASCKLCNLDCTVMAQKPKLASFIPEIRKTLAQTFGSDISQISVKATTTEKLGFVGRGEGIAAEAVILLES